jgi:hypothetical protein
MTDGGALVAGFSRTLHTLAPSLTGVVTVGQAFGGDLEAVTLHTGLLAPSTCSAPTCDRQPGAGQPRHRDAVGLLRGGRGEGMQRGHRARREPVGALRISDADPRPRHRGVSTTPDSRSAGSRSAG